MTLYSFRKLNPDWNVILCLCKPSKIMTKTWDSSPTQDFFTFTGVDYLHRIEELDIQIITDWDIKDPNNKLHPDSMGPARKGDFFKWQKLAENSGFYSDTDVLYVKPMKTYYDKVKDFDLAICWNGRYFSIGFLGSSGDNQFYRDLYTNVFKNFRLDKYQSTGVKNIYNWFGCKVDLWEKLKLRYSGIRCYNNSMNFVYPWTAMKMAEVFERNHTTLPGDCYGIHWYGGHAISQKFNNILTSKNYKKYTNTFTTFAEKILCQ